MRFLTFLNITLLYPNILFIYVPEIKHYKNYHELFIACLCFWPVKYSIGLCGYLIVGKVNVLQVYKIYSGKQIQLPF